MVLVYVVQKLALRRTLHITQSFTSVHDKTAAWFGFAAAIPVVFRYLPMLSCKTGKDAPVRDWPAFAGVLGILAYLGCGLLLGTIAPSLVTPGLTFTDATEIQSLAPPLEDIGRDQNQYVQHMSN